MTQEEWDEMMNQQDKRLADLWKAVDTILNPNARASNDPEPEIRISWGPDRFQWGDTPVIRPRFTHHIIKAPSTQTIPFERV